MKRHIKRSFGSDFSRNAREGHPKNLESQVPEEKPSEICDHIIYCTFRKGIRDQHKYIDCSVPQEKYKCGRIKKFYDKWKEAGNQLGVGS